MTEYTTDVVVPEIVKAFFESFTNLGAVDYQPGADTLRFTFDADDLWNASEICHSVEQEVGGWITEGVNIPKPKPMEAKA